MDHTEALWLEAAGRVQASVDADARAEAYEVFVAEAARCRIEDRTGGAEIRLRCGAILAGVLEPRERIDGHLGVCAPSGKRYLVPVAAVLSLAGSRGGLREESGASTVTVSATSWLREIWSWGERIRVLDAGGSWWAGVIEMVGADHVELAVDVAPRGARTVVIPLAAVEAWEW